jgi:hypothetical protein
MKASTGPRTQPARLSSLLVSSDHESREAGRESQKLTFLTRDHRGKPPPKLHFVRLAVCCWAADLKSHRTGPYVGVAAAGRLQRIARRDSHGVVGFREILGSAGAKRDKAG